MKTAQRIAFVQHGDYREAFQRFSQGGAETYAAQRYSVDLVGELARDHEVCVLTVGGEPYKERLENGVLTLGLGARDRRGAWRALSFLNDFAPTHLVLRTPWLPLLGWGLARVPHVLPMLADSFNDRPSTKERLKLRTLSAMLSAPKVSIVSNHNIAACEGLVRLGVPARKVVPWDWPPQRRPEQTSVRRHPGKADFSLFFAGSVTREKGVTDLLETVRLCRQGGHEVTARIAGGGQVDEMARLAEELGIADSVIFLGRVPNEQVFSEMRQSGAVVVPSRHSYPEGLPMTIYEGLCSRTPLLLSDHPMFTRALKHSSGCRFFSASNPESLMERVVELIEKADVYESLSEQSASAWSDIQVPLSWGDVLHGWLESGKDSATRFASQSLA